MVQLQLAGCKTGGAAPQRMKDRNSGEEPGLSIVQQAWLKDSAHGCRGPGCKGPARGSEEAIARCTSSLESKHVRRFEISFHPGARLTETSRRRCWRGRVEYLQASGKGQRKQLLQLRREQEQDLRPCRASQYKRRPRRRCRLQAGERKGIGDRGPARLTSPKRVRHRCWTPHLTCQLCSPLTLRSALRQARRSPERYWRYLKLGPQ